MGGVKLKIAFIYDAAYPWIKGGGEKSLYDLAVSLRERGHELHFFAMHCWDGASDIKYDGLFYHALCPNFPLYNSQGRRSIWQAILFGWGVLTRLPRVQLSEFDIVDIHAFPFFSVPAFWLVRALFARRIPWVLTWLEVWGLDYWKRYLGKRGWAGAILEWLSSRLPMFHLCISPTTAHRLHTLLGVQPERIHIIPRGIAPLQYSSESARKCASRVIFVGRLLAHKRVELLIRSWPSVLRHIPSAHLHIVGDGPERFAVQELAQHQDVSGSVHFHGQIADHGEVLRWIASASLLVLPSVREGQSTVLLEAMALGTAVLAAQGNETAATDFLGTDEVASWAVLPCNASSEDWARRIGLLLKQPLLLEQLASNGRLKSAELRWHDNIVCRIETFYERVRSECSTRSSS